MHGWMTNRHEGCVSTMLTESDFSIALPVRRFKGLYDEMEGARQQARHCGVFSVLTTDRFGPNRLKRYVRSLWRVGCADRTARSHRSGARRPLFAFGCD
jgi:hypothetical protein